MERAGINPAVVSYGTAINAAANYNSSSLAVSLLDTMMTAEEERVAAVAAATAAGSGGSGAAAVAEGAAAVERASVAPNDSVFTSALKACENDPDDSAAAAAAQRIVDVMASVGVEGMNEDLRARLGRQAKRMLGRDTSARDLETLSKDEEALGMSLKGRQSAV